MNLHGVDVFLWSSELPRVPDQIGKMTLIFISSRGTRVYPGPAPAIEGDDWPRCRYVSQEEITDSEVQELLDQLTTAGWRWTKAQKLFWKEGVKQYSEPY